MQPRGEPYTAPIEVSLLFTSSHIPGLRLSWSAAGHTCYSAMPDSVSFPFLSARRFMM